MSCIVRQSHLSSPIDLALCLRPHEYITKALTTLWGVEGPFHHTRHLGSVPFLESREKK